MIFDTFSETDILSEKGGVYYYKGNQLDPETAADVRQQAAQIRESMLWRMLKAEVQWYILKTLMEKGETADDLRFAKLAGNILKIEDDWLKRLGG